MVMGWITYASYYLGRVNLSTAIPDLREDLHLSSQDVGLLGSGFFLSYAAGKMSSAQKTRARVQLKGGKAADRTAEMGHLDRHVERNRIASTTFCYGST